MRRAFTLIELIVVIIIVGILAAVGISQYSTTVEKSRLAEAKIRIGVMKQLAYQYYLENGSLNFIQNSNVGVDNTCASTGFFRYTMEGSTSTSRDLDAYRCTSGGKSPNASREYVYYLVFYPSAAGEAGNWFCKYTDDGSLCFGLPADSGSR